MLEVKNLTKKYQHGGVQFEAVHDVSFSLEKGKFIVLMGHSGCGKSTLFHMMTGLTKPDEGTVFFEGKEITAMSQKELARLRGTKIGYILQGQNLPPNFTIIENVCMPAFLGNYQEDTYEYGKKLLKDFGLEGMENELPSALSGGEQRRVAIARALVHKPELIIADEPTSNLDEENSELILKYFKKISQDGMAVLISSHTANAVPYGDEIWQMRKGSIEELS